MNGTTGGMVVLGSGGNKEVIGGSSIKGGGGGIGPGIKHSRTSIQSIAGGKGGVVRVVTGGGVVELDPDGGVVNVLIGGGSEVPDCGVVRVVNTGGVVGGGGVVGVGVGVGKSEGGKVVGVVGVTESCVIVTDPENPLTIFARKAAPRGWTTSVLGE